MPKQLQRANSAVMLENCHQTLPPAAVSAAALRTPWACDCTPLPHPRYPALPRVGGRQASLRAPAPSDARHMICRVSACRKID